MRRASIHESLPLDGCPRDGDRRGPDPVGDLNGRQTDAARRGRPTRSQPATLLSAETRSGFRSVGSARSRRTVRRSRFRAVKRPGRSAGRPSPPIANATRGQGFSPAPMPASHRSWTWTKRTDPSAMPEACSPALTVSFDLPPRHGSRLRPARSRTPHIRRVRAERNLGWTGGPALTELAA